MRMSSIPSRVSALLLMVTLAGVVASNAGDRPAAYIPSPAVDAALTTARAEQTAVVAGGCFWGIQAVFQHVKGVIRRHVRLFRRRGQHCGIRTGKQRRHRPRGIGEDYLRRFSDHLRAASAGLLLGRARSHAIKPSGTRHRQSVSFVHFLRQRRAKTNRRSVHRATREGQGLPASHRDSSGPLESLLSRRGLPPGLRCPSSRQSLHRVQRRAESGEPSATVSGSLHGQVANLALCLLECNARRPSRRLAQAVVRNNFLPNGHPCTVRILSAPRKRVQYQ